MLIIQYQCFVIIKAGASKNGWGTFCPEIPIRGNRHHRNEMHINIMELKATKLVLMSFHKQIKMKVVHFKIDSIWLRIYDIIS